VRRVQVSRTREISRTPTHATSGPCPEEGGGYIKIILIQIHRRYILRANIVHDNTFAINTLANEHVLQLIS